MEEIYVTIYTFILLVFAFVAKAVMDISAKDGFKNDFWNKSESWQNKYQFPLIKNYKHWYYFGLIKPIYKEWFPFSSTALVWVTDGWHLSQMIFLNCMFVALAINMDYPLLDYIAIRVIYSIVFNKFYK